jgi:hypothetical protein
VDGNGLCILKENNSDLIKYKYGMWSKPNKNINAGTVYSESEKINDVLTVKYCLNIL